MTPNPRLSFRYAKSLIDLAEEKGQLEQVHQDMVYLKQLTNASRDFVNVLRSPVVSGDKKQQVFDALTTGKISTMTTSFSKLLIAKGREGNLPEVIEAFIKQYKEHKNIHTVKLTTAVEVSDEVKRNILAKVQSTGNMPNIELESIVNPDIIGGFIVQAGDKLVDASIANTLKEVSREFENNDFIYKVK